MVGEIKNEKKNVESFKVCTVTEFNLFLFILKQGRSKELRWWDLMINVSCRFETAHSTTSVLHVKKCTVARDARAQSMCDVIPLHQWYQCTSRVLWDRPRVKIMLYYAKFAGFFSFFFLFPNFEQTCFCSASLCFNASFFFHYYYLFIHSC